MPPLEDQNVWVEEVCEVTADLEGLNDYKPKNAKNKITKLGAPRGIDVLEVHNHSTWMLTVITKCGVLMRC